MAVNARIYLPLSAKSQCILETIGKVAGAPTTIETFPLPTGLPRRLGQPDSMPPAHPAFDPKQPSSDGNPWHVRVARKAIHMAVTPNDFSFGSLVFQDAAGGCHQWTFHTEIEDEHSKQLSPGSNALAVAIGRRLVRFFGGKLIPCDSTDRVDLTVSNAKARFPTIRAGQTSNDRWHQFHNALASEPVLSSAELRQALSTHGDFSGDEALLHCLESRERHQSLQGSVSEAHTSRLTPGRRARI